MLIDVLVISVVVALLLRGRFSRLAQVDIKAPTLALIVVVIQYGGQYLVDLGAEWLFDVGPVLYPLSLALLLWVVWKNRGNPAMLLIGFGIFLNALVITVNGGKMPVSTDALTQAGLHDWIAPLSDQVLTHQALTPETKLAFLADIFALAPPYPRPKVISIGDVFLSAGAIWLIVGGMLGARSVTSKRTAVLGRQVTRIP